MVQTDLEGLILLLGRWFFFQVKRFFRISKENDRRWVIIFYMEIYFTKSDTYRDSIWVNDQHIDFSIWVYFEVHVAWYECWEHTMTLQNERGSSVITWIEDIDMNLCQSRWKT